MVDFIIVGQGIAGTLIAHFLEKNQQTFIVFENEKQQTASMVSNGILNPVTGRSIVKSWLIDELIPFSDSVYSELEQKLQTSFFRKVTVHKLLNQIREVNEWSVRKGDESYQKYIDDTLENYDELPIQNELGGFKIKECRQLDMKKLCLSYRNYLKEKKQFVSEKLDFSTLNISAEKIEYKGYTAKAIIFCEGATVVNNPYFNSLPFILARGETLELEIPDLNITEIYNNGKIIAPLPNGNYWFGATFTRTPTEEPTEGGRAELENEYAQFISKKAVIKKHESALRPTTKDRRPYIGTHSIHKNIHLFNGLGTKAVSLGPLLAKEFIDYVVFNQPFRKEVDLRRAMK